MGNNAIVCQHYTYNINPISHHIVDLTLMYLYLWMLLQFLNRVDYFFFSVFLCFVLFCFRVKMRKIIDMQYLLALMYTFQFFITLYERVLTGLSV